jgi:flagellar biosynthesis chaperone FliJ
MSQSPESAAASSAARQFEALRRLQAQAEQRIKLGQQLFKAAEAQASAHQDAIEQVRGEQERLREQVQQDVAQSLHAYDQWVGQIDESFTKAIRSLEERVDTLARDWEQTQGKLDVMVRRSEALLDKSRQLIEGATPTASKAARPTPSAASAPPPRPLPMPKRSPSQQPEAPTAGPRYQDLIRKLHPETESPNASDRMDDRSDEDRPPLRRSA